MTVTVTNLIQGPANLWIGAFGTAEPATTATVPAAGWVDAGGTQDGVTLTVEQEFSPLTVDQVVDEAGATRTARRAKVKTNLAEATLANFAQSLNELAASVASSVFTPTNGDKPAAFAVPYVAVLLRGLGPGGIPRDIIVRRTIQTANTESSYKKDGQLLIPVEYQGFFVSTSIVPFVIKDA